MSHELATVMSMLGSVYWLTHKDRSHPHVVIEEGIDGDPDQVLVCAITTNQTKASFLGNVVLEIGEAGLLKPSIVETSKSFAVPKSELGECIGSLKSNRINEIRLGLGFVERMR